MIARAVVVILLRRVISLASDGVLPIHAVLVKAFVSFDRRWLELLVLEARTIRHDRLGAQRSCGDIVHDVAEHRDGL